MKNIIRFQTIINLLYFLHESFSFNYELHSQEEAHRRSMWINILNCLWFYEPFWNIEGTTPSSNFERRIWRNCWHNSRYVCSSFFKRWAFSSDEDLAICSKAQLSTLVFRTQNKNRFFNVFLIVQSFLKLVPHGSALEGSDPHELAAEFEVCRMKGTHIGVSELTLFKSYEIGLLRIRPLCFWTIK